MHAGCFRCTAMCVHVQLRAAQPHVQHNHMCSLQQGACYFPGCRLCSMMVTVPGQVISVILCYILGAECLIKAH